MAMAGKRVERCSGRLCATLTVLAVVCLASLMLMWPWQPEVEIVRMVLRRVKVHPVPPISAALWVSLTVRVHNHDIYWMELRDVDVGLKYRGRKLGHLETEGWHVRSWDSCNVFGDLEFHGLPAPDVVHLVEDMAKGRVHFHAVAEVTGNFGLLFYHFTRDFKAIRACEILINSKNHTIIHQHCIHKD